MRIAFVYGEWSVANRPFEIDRLWDSDRGLTGSELSCFSFARAMAQRGHSVELYVPYVGEATQWEGIPVYHCERDKIRISDKEVAYVWNEPDQCRFIHRGVLRVVNQQLNDFSFCRSGFDRAVDLYTSPSEDHMAHLVAQPNTSPEKWVVLPNGCDLTEYGGVQTEEGRSLARADFARHPKQVMWASSPDRGLHWLLQAWPAIRRRVPGAELRIFYNIRGWLDRAKEWIQYDGMLREQGYRAHYVAEALRRLRGHGVDCVGSVSRSRMALEWGNADLLAYPCDTITYTEGFCVTLLEACAAGVPAVSAKTDALPSIYGGVVPMVGVPVKDHLGHFVDAAVEALTMSYDQRQALRQRTTEFAAEFTWRRLAARLEEILERELARKRQRRSA